jgi:hypothetical protein
LRTTRSRAFRPNWHDRRQPGHVRPEALGSPAGYAVPPGQCLLWPHPSLWLTSYGDLWFSPPGSSRPRYGSRRESQRVPNLLCLAVCPCRLPYPGGPEGCAWLSLPPRVSLHPAWTGSASTSQFSRLQSSLDATAWTVASPPQEDVYIRAFVEPVARTRRRI